MFTKIPIVYFIVALTITFNGFAQDKTGKRKFSKQEVIQHFKRIDSLKAVQKKEILNKQAPDFNVTTIEGKNIMLSELKGKVVLLNFWFTTCKPCIKEIPELNNLIKEITSRDMIFLSFCNDSKEKMEILLDRLKLPFNFEKIANAQSEAQKYMVTSYPCNIVVDKNGIVKYIHDGYSNNSVKILRKKMIKELKK